MQPLQKTCLIRVRGGVRARARVGGSSVACQRPAQAASPFQRGGACSSEQPSCRRRSPSLKPDMQMAHAAGCTMLGSESDAACLGLAKQSSSASTRWAFSMQPASGTPCASISRLRSPTGKPASASAPAHAPGAPRQKICTGVPLSPTLQSPRRCVAQRGASRRGYGGRGGAWRWHRVAAPRSGRAARPRRLRWRGRAIERSRPPLRSRPLPIGCRKESPTLRGTTADGDEVGWGWVGVGVSGRGGGLRHRPQDDEASPRDARTAQQRGPCGERVRLFAASGRYTPVLAIASRPASGSQSTLSDEHAVAGWQGGLAVVIAICQEQGSAASAFVLVALS